MECESHRATELSKGQGALAAGLDTIGLRAIGIESDSLHEGH